MVSDTTFIDGRFQRDAPDTVGRLLKLKDVCENVGLSKTKIYRAMKDETLAFPKPVKIGSASRWIERDIIAWKQSIAGS